MNLDENQTDICSIELKSVTKTINKGLSAKRSYVKIPNDTRHKLIEAVEQGESIICAAKRLGIKYSTAKTICKVYKSEGRADKKGVGRTGSRAKILRNTDDRNLLSVKIKEEDINKDKEYRSQTQNPFHQANNPLMKSISGVSEAIASVQKGSEFLLRSLNLKTFQENKPYQDINYKIFKEQTTNCALISLASEVDKLPSAQQKITILDPIYPSAQASTLAFPSNLQTLINIPNNLTMFSQNLPINHTQSINPSFWPLSNIKPISGESLSLNANSISASMQPQQYFQVSRGTRAKMNPQTHQISQITVVLQPVLYLPAQNINVSLNTFSQSISNQYICLPPSYH